MSSASFLQKEKKGQSFLPKLQALPELKSVVQLRLHLEVPFLLLGLRTLKGDVFFKKNMGNEIEEGSKFSNN